MSTPVPPQLQGFAPLLGSRPRILILGSMPSVRSLEEQQYYGHPRNRFWPLMERLFGIDASLDYAARCADLRARQVAVWDVLASCRRPGSLDSAIERSSEIPNSIPTLLAETASIHALAFNGRAAQQLFQRHWGEQPELKGRHQLALPSTSPANAAWSLERLQQRWSVLLDYLD